MQENIRILNEEHILHKLRHTPFPPKKLYVRGAAGAPHNLLITIVGSRNCSSYGKQVVEEICKALRGQPVSIISGLAQGIDSHAHICALKYNLHTIAVLGCGLSEKILQTHSKYKLSQKILMNGGALISEYMPDQSSRSWMFPARNRIMVGISDLIIVIEAKEKSGTSITARLATDYNRDLLVVPNSIYSLQSKGSNELIKHGAYMYTKPEDIFNLLKLEYKEEQKINSYTPTPLEKEILNAIANNIQTTQEIIEHTVHLYSVSEIIQSLLNLEIEEIVRRVDGRYSEI